MRNHLQLSPDTELEALFREASEYPRSRDHDPAGEPPPPTLSLDIMTSIGRLSFIGATTVFGSPLDVTLDELSIELLYP